MSLVRALCLLSAVEWLARGHGQGAAPAVQLCCNFGACSPPIRTAAVPRSPAQLGKPLSPPLSCLAPAVHDPGRHLPLPLHPQQALRVQLPADGCSGLHPLQLHHGGWVFGLVCMEWVG